MTLLASWIGVDTHGPTSAYIVSDSRFSWNPTTYFNYGEKVFASKVYPELFGYAGDVLFPSTILSQLIEMIDAGVLFNQDMTCEDKHRIVFEKLCTSLMGYPLECCADATFQILHISRDTIVKKPAFFSCRVFEWKKNEGWKVIEREMPKESGILFVLGKGKDSFYDKYKNYQFGNNRSTSRNVFHCFADTLFNIKDYTCGGPPQLVGLFRKPNTSGINFGIIYNEKRYFCGSELTNSESYGTIPWRNELFELCDGTTKQIIPNAMKQPASPGKK